MTATLNFFASNTLTLLGIALLAASVWCLQDDPAALGPMLGAFALLAMNLAAALLTHPRLRRDRGLLLLHLSLLSLLCLAGAGRLARFEAQVELVDGQSLVDAAPVVTVRGPWHRDALADVDFTQGFFTVDYAPGLRRGDTRSRVMVEGQERQVGDEDALVLEGYRFTTTHNKGYAVLLTWIPDRGEVLRGAVNMPGYPLYDGHQENRFSLPGGPVLDLALRLAEPARGDRAWRLDSRRAKGSLNVRLASFHHVLAPGDSLGLPGGRLRFEAIHGWMGYKVFHDPTLPWLFASAIMALAGLLWHLIGSRVGKARLFSRQQAVPHVV